MRFDWPRRPLHELTINFDTLRKPVKEAERIPGPYPYYGASGIVDHVDGYLFDGEYLLIAEDGENLRTRNTPIAFRAMGKFWVNNHAHILQGNEEASTRFLEYAVLAADIGPYLTGAVMPKLTQANLNSMQVSCPPRAVQEGIVGVLGTIDDRIDLLRQTNSILESIAQALFKSWFVDFDPVRAKAEGREPEGMDAATAALFPSEFEESASGLIPRGWRWADLSAVAELNARSWTGRRSPGEVVYIDLAGVKANVFDTPQRYAFAEAPSRARRELRAGDTLVGTVRPGNRSFGFIAQAEVGLTGSTGFAVLSPRALEAAAFTYLCATRDVNIERLATLADGGAYPAVRPDLVLQTQCALPTESVFSAFASIVQPLLTSVAANAVRARVLGEVRDSLLPRLVSGRLRLPDVAEELEVAAA
jgi:type I restriction enzyme S subunit